MSKKREQLLAKVLADPNTAKIAKSLGAPLEEYAALVVEFAMNPNKPLNLEIIPDEVLKAQGVHVPTEREMADFVNEFVAINNQADSTDYRAKKKEVVALPLDPVQESTTSPVDPKLAAEVLKRRK